MVRLVIAEGDRRYKLIMNWVERMVAEWDEYSSEEEDDANEIVELLDRASREESVISKLDRAQADPSNASGSPELPERLSSAMKKLREVIGVIHHLHKKKSSASRNARKRAAKIRDARNPGVRS